MEHTLQPILPIFLLFVCVIGLALGLLAIANIFNPGRPGSVIRMPYESGMNPIHDTRRRFDVRFYLLAIAFLVFDVELLFLYPWAVAWRPAVAEHVDRPAAVAQSVDIANTSSAVPAVSHRERNASPAPIENRRLVFWAIMVFVGLLVLGFVYDWRKGVFQWR